VQCSPFEQAGGIPECCAKFPEPLRVTWRLCLEPRDTAVSQHQIAAALVRKLLWRATIPRMPCDLTVSMKMTREETMTDWIQLIRAEYHELPGLHLTKPQIQRLWNLDTTMCEAVLQELEAARFLRRTHNGAYVKA
jgi:hypothetical protein